MSYRPYVKTSNGIDDMNIDAETITGHSVGYVELNSNSTELTDAQYAECLKDIVVIKSISATNAVSYYLKMAISNSTITFSKKIEQISTYTSNYCSQFQDLIYIKRADKTVRFTSERIIDLYNKSQTDNLLATKQGALTFNPTVPSGTTPTPLVNLKDGDNYYSFSSSSGDIEVMTQTQFDNATGGTSPDVPVDTFSVEEINIDDNLIDGNKAKFVCDEYDKRNLINSSNIIVGRKVTASSGEIGSESVTNGTDYIEIEPNTRYINNFQPKWSGSYGVAFYNSNKTYISGYNTNSSSYRDFTTPSNAKYLIICWYVSSGSGYSTTNPSLSKYGGGEIIRANNIEPILLWENGNPYTSFASGNVSIVDSSQYKHLIVGCMINTSTVQAVQYFKIQNITGRTAYLSLTDNTSNTLYHRGMKINSSTQIEFQSGYTNSSSNNSCCIPAIIYGTNVL